MTRETEAGTPRLDLVLTRVIDAPRALIWQVWTDPEHVKKWWAPKPWTTVECEMDLRPGGIFRTVMRSPEGQDYPNAGCFLELVKNEKIVWTNALEPGYRPALGESGEDCSGLLFTAIITLEERAGKTHYAVRVLHRDEAGRKKHEEMGFHLGWNQCLDQLIELVGQLKR
ncbi:MAG: SRPBCC family protein [Gammaproteobacteria bacterium]